MSYLDFAEQSRRSTDWRRLNVRWSPTEPTRYKEKHCGKYVGHWYLTSKIQFSLTDLYVYQFTFII